MASRPLIGNRKLLARVFASYAVTSFFRALLRLPIGIKTPSLLYVESRPTQYYMLPFFNTRWEQITTMPPNTDQLILYALHVMSGDAVKWYFDSSFSEILAYSTELYGEVL